MCPDRVVAAFDFSLQRSDSVGHKFQSQQTSSAIVNEIQPIDYQEQQERLAEAGAKAAARCGLALGSGTVHGDVATGRT